MLIDRPDNSGKKLEPLDDPQKIERMKQELAALKHEIGEVSAHLDQTSKLVILQEQIESDKNQYLRADRDRLKILANQDEAKAEKLSRDIAEQNKRIEALQGTLGMAPAAKNQTGLGSSMVMDEFKDADSVQIQQNENMLYINIHDAEFDKSIISTFMKSYKHGSKPEDILTMVTIAYFDHNLWPSRLEKGLIPQYGTKASFKNKMDGPFFDYLQSNSVQFQIHLSGGNNEQVLLGQCTVPLSKLTTSSVFGASSLQPQIVEDNYKIMLAAGIQDQINLPANTLLGYLRVGMRLRKAIDQAIRDNQSLNQVNDAYRQMNAGNAPSIVGRKFIITVQVLQARGLKNRSGNNLQKMAPFYQYEFYTFPEFFSKIGSGPDAKFGETSSYNLPITDGSLNYLETQSLDINIVDDNAPVGGLGRGGQGNGDETELEDLIGTCSVPLHKLSKAQGIDGEFDVTNEHNESCGKLLVKISVIDTLKDQNQSQNNLQGTGVQYQTRYQNDVLMRIAKKLQTIKQDPDQIFGVFTSGRPSCSFEDFKYWCRRTLKLQDEISDQEFDRFLSSQIRLQGKNSINKQDFVEIFGRAIQQSRVQYQEDAASFNATINQRQGPPTHFQSANELSGKRGLDETQVPQEFGRNIAMGILMKCILASSLEEIISEIDRRTKKNGNGMITFKDVAYVLEMFGGASPQDIEKIRMHLGGPGLDQIFKSQLVNLLEQSKDEAKFSNPQVQKFNTLILKETQSISEMFIQKDFNQDCTLNLDGFKSAVLSAIEISDFKITIPQLKEIFNLVSENQQFHYVEYICQQVDKARPYFQKLKGIDKIDQSMASINMSGIDQSLDLSPQKPMDQTRQSIKQQPAKKVVSKTAKDPSPALLEARRKIEDYLIVNDVTLSILFNVIDSNSDNRLTKQEFKHKIRGLHIGLEEAEIEELFKDLDANNDGHIVYDEFVKQFTSINTAQIITKMRKIMYGAQTNAEYIFNRHCQTKAINLTQFKSMLHSMFPKRIVDFEIEGIFSLLVNKQNETSDRQSDKITLEYFHTIFGIDEQEQQFQIGIEDIIKPLSTIMKRIGVLPEEIFQRYDLNNNHMLSADELQAAVKGEMSIELTKEEVSTMHEFFMAKYRRTQIKLQEFKELMDKKTIRQYRAKDAQKALAKIKNKYAKSTNDSIEKYLENFGKQVKSQQTTQKKKHNVISQDEISIREFKRAMHNKGWFTQQQINNLAKYMDRGNDGIILIKEVSLAIKGDYAPNNPRNRK